MQENIPLGYCVCKYVVHLSPYRMIPGIYIQSNQIIWTYIIISLSDKIIMNNNYFTVNIIRLIYKTNYLLRHLINL